MGGNAMLAVIDRFEGGFALCESLADGQMRRLDRSALPPEAKEGDVLRIARDSVTIDSRLTEKRKADMQKRMDRLWK
jgi:hypothetical protein